MGIQQEYASKLTTARKAVEAVRSGQWLDYGWGAMLPVALDGALAEKMPELHGINIRGGMALGRPAIFDIEEQAAHFAWNSWHMTQVERGAIPGGFGYYAPLRYSELPRYYRDMPDGVDVAMFQVAPMDEHGFFNFGPSVSHLSAVCERAKTVIVEVNPMAPRCLGGFGTDVHVSQVDMVVECGPLALPEIPPAAITPVDEKVGRYIVEQIPNGACIQVGIGGMPNAICRLIAESDLKDLGIHTELYVDGMLEIVKAGKVNGSKKTIDRGRQTYSFAAGTKSLYEYIDNNPECMSAPVDYCNSVQTIASLDRFISINNAVEVDLFGQVSSESAGLRHISGAGGQLDFVLGAYLSDGGKSFVCLSSSVTDKHGERRSRIVPTLREGTVVTDTRTNLHYLATEYGVINLKGLSAWQRAEAIISLAHPDFREQLIQASKRMNIWKRSNKRGG
jgi:butyryl-CoA:acetate CoA-transferase